MIGARFPGRKRIHALTTSAHCLLALVTGLWLLQPGRASAAPRVAVVGSSTAVAWLRSTGLECLEITGEQLGASPPDVPLIVLPLDQLRSDAALRSLIAFTARGGKVVAVYWGTIARPEQQSAYPVYEATSLLGVRVAGWTLTGPADVQPEPAADGAPAAPAADRGAAAGTGRSPGSEQRLERAMLIQVEPMPTAQVLARLAPVSGGTRLVLAVRNGNTFYMAANLFQGDPHSPELRRLFFWILDQAVPGIVFSQARERAGAAVAGVIRARERLAGLPSPTAAAIQRLLDQADEAAARAKALAAGDRYLESITAAEQAHELTDRATGMMESR